jgi:hypothetical protein
MGNRGAVLPKRLVILRKQEAAFQKVACKVAVFSLYILIFCANSDSECLFMQNLD